MTTMTWTEAHPPERIRVAQVITRFIAGGGGVALRGALALDPDRFETVIITGPGGPLAERASAAGFEVLILRHMRPEFAPAEAFAGAREIRTLLEVGRFDVVHTHSSKAGALGRFAARAAGVPAVVHTFHGFPFHDFQSPLRRTAYIAAERRLGRITDRFIAVGVSVAAEAVRLGLAAPERMRVIPVSVDGRSVVQTPQTRARARQLLGIPEQAELIGTVGRIDSQKAPHHFVEAMALMRRPDVHAVWIGDGPLRSQTESLIRRRGLGGRVHLVGERSDVADLLPGLDVFVMTSLYEGLPCAIVEAMRCGLPVVASAVNGVPELVVPGQTGLLVPPARPAAVAAAVGHLLDHPDVRGQMAHQGRLAVAGRFLAADAGLALGALYEEVLGLPAQTLPLFGSRPA
jgi:glycosyltransferase involved in cell wall biosynthesis